MDNDKESREKCILCNKFEELTEDLCNTCFLSKEIMIIAQNKKIFDETFKRLKAKIGTKIIGTKPRQQINLLPEKQEELNYIESNFYSSRQKKLRRYFFDKWLALVISYDVSYEPQDNEIRINPAKEKTKLKQPDKGQERYKLTPLGKVMAADLKGEPEEEVMKKLYSLTEEDMKISTDAIKVAQAEKINDVKPVVSQIGNSAENLPGVVKEKKSTESIKEDPGIP